MSLVSFAATGAFITAFAVSAVAVCAVAAGTAAVCAGAIGAVAGPCLATFSGTTWSWHLGDEGCSNC